MGDPRNIIFFDGNCMLCNNFIAYLVKKKRPALFFCDIHSQTANNLLSEFRLYKTPKNTIYFLKDNQLFTKSTAVIKIMSQLNPFLKVVGNIFLIVPQFIRDTAYSFIANNRYKFFKQTTCYTPTNEEKEQFL